MKIFNLCLIKKMGLDSWAENKAKKVRDVYFSGESASISAPYDQATKLPHNMKIFNLCLIKKMGLDSWAENKAKKVRDVYFSGEWKL